MLIAAFILVMSLAATVQFAVFIWRAGLLRVAAEPVSEPMLAAETSANPLNTNDFASATAVQGLFPDLDTNAVPKFRAVRLCRRAPPDSAAGPPARWRSVPVTPRWYSRSASSGIECCATKPARSKQNLTASSSLAGSVFRFAFNSAASSLGHSWQFPMQRSVRIASCLIRYLLRSFPRGCRPFRA